MGSDPDSIDGGRCQPHRLGVNLSNRTRCRFTSSAADAIASLNSSPQGLSSVEAMRRLSEYGLNRVEEVARESILLRFLKEFTHFFALILWLAAGLAFVAEWSDPGHGMAKVGYAILAVIVVSGLFSFWQEFRVERTLAALRGCFRSKSMCSAMARRSGCSLNDSSGRHYPVRARKTFGGLSFGRGLRSSH